MKTIVITGATSGFGKLLVENFLSKGYKVVATGRNIKKRSEINFESKGEGSLIKYDLDLTDENQISTFTQFCTQELGQIDTLINNAGYGLFGALENYTEEQIRSQFEVNFFGLVFVTKNLLPLVRKAKGKIFNFSSGFGLNGFPLTSMYCATKFAVEGFTESLAMEVAQHGVQACLVEPGAYRTNFSQNITWAENKTDVYTAQSKNYRQFQKMMATRPNYQDPKEVADGVAKLVEKNKIPLRVAYGKDTKFAKVFRKITPEQVYFNVAKKVIGKLLAKDYQ